MATLEFDELNEFQLYFKPMQITDEHKKKREELAMALYDVMLFFFSAIEVYSRNGDYTADYFQKMLYEKLIDTVVNHTGTDDVLQDYLYKLSGDITNVTIRQIFHFNNPSYKVGVGETTLSKEDENNLKDNYWLSESRAFFIATNETNTILNYSEFSEAIANGMTKKKWQTMKDERVRATHIELDGIEIDIEDVFVVGESYMRYPRDFEYGADLNEIIGCRCSLSYS